MFPLQKILGGSTNPAIALFVRKHGFQLFCDRNIQSRKQVLAITSRAGSSVQCQFNCLDDNEEKGNNNNEKVFKISVLLDMP